MDVFHVVYKVISTPSPISLVLHLKLKTRHLVQFLQRQQRYEERFTFLDDFLIIS